MKETIYKFSALFLMSVFTLLSCGENNKICNVENPLTDLPWLKEIVNGFEGNEITFSKHARIYQSTYKDGTCFLLELCIECADYGFELRDCEGKILCILYGHSGDPCSEYSVDFENKQLIWEINN